MISQRQTSEARADMAMARHFVDLFPPESAESSRAASPPTEETILTWISNPLENSLDHPESRPLSNSPARSGKKDHTVSSLEQADLRPSRVRLEF